VGLAPTLIDGVLDVGAAAVVLMPAISCEDVLVEWLEIDVAGLRCFAFASSLGTFGPPAREHATLCRMQFEHGASSLHCECEILVSLTRRFRKW
jgi:hypothetical protein